MKVADLKVGMWVKDGSYWYQYTGETFRELCRDWYVFNRFDGKFAFDDLRCFQIVREV